MTAVLERPAHATLRRDASRFYLFMAAACAGVAFLGFAPTYWLPIARGALSVHPVIHIHALVFFIWSAFLVVQVWLATSGHLARHRAMGMVGVSLATAMTIFGVLATIRQIENAAALNQTRAGEAFAIVPFAGIMFFAVTFVLAVANVRRPDVHKRLMLLSSIAILDAPVARWFITFLAPPGPAGPPPVEVAVLPALVAMLLLLVAMAFDWRTLGRPHKVYVIGGFALLTLKLAQVPLSTTPFWHGIAAWLHGLAA